jgi:hypothetical protein
VNEPARDVEDQPGHDPNDKEEYRQNQKKEVSQDSFTLTGWTPGKRKSVKECLKRWVLTNLQD